MRVGPRSKLTWICLVGSLWLGGCRGRPPEPPDLQAVRWNHYHSELGFSFEYPDVYVVDDASGTGRVLLRHEGYPVISIAHTDEREADRNGLWGGREPSGAITLGGRPGLRYVYDHHDGPFSMHTVSHVVDHRGLLLGFEFRTESDTPDAVQRHMLESFRFDDGEVSADRRDAGEADAIR